METNFKIPNVMKECYVSDWEDISVKNILRAQALGYDVEVDGNEKIVIVLNYYKE